MLYTGDMTKKRTSTIKNNPTIDMSKLPTTAKYNIGNLRIFFEWNNRETNKDTHVTTKRLALIKANWEEGKVNDILLLDGDRGSESMRFSYIHNPSIYFKGVDGYITAPFAFGPIRKFGSYKLEKYGESFFGKERYYLGELFDKNQIKCGGQTFISHETLLAASDLVRKERLEKIEEINALTEKIKKEKLAERRIQANEKRKRTALQNNFNKTCDIIFG